MTDLTFDQSLALSLYQSQEQFPVDLDEAWKWLGYSRKDSCLEMIERVLEEGLDFSRTCRKSTGGRPKQDVMLSIEGFKSLGMFSQTEQGKVIRKYFLECERIAKAATPKAQHHVLPPVSTVEIDALISRESAIKDRLKALETEVQVLRTELQSNKQQQAKIAKAFIQEHRNVVEYSVKCSEIVDAYAQQNKYFPNPLNK
ncbi:hypothetical protein [Nostoc sp.]|uniref:hypothetical protein n=1 Tax=Nostoc sp. TaxID=1180 RepID=UPI002FFCFE23